MSEFKKQTIIGPADPLKAPPNEVDLTTNRNEKMIRALLSPSANGLFLFYLDGMNTNIMMPPGLTDEEIDYFKQEFTALFEKYAKRANKKRN